jgi:hypothetical protein
MTPIRLLASVAAVAVFAAALAPPMLGYSTYGKWGTLNAPMYVNPANADVSLSAAVTAVQAAMAVWNTQAGTPFRFSYAGQTNNTASTYDNKSVILFRQSSNGGAIASTYAWSVNGVLVEADIVYWDGGFKFFTGTSGCSSGAYIEDIGAHELGHAMGLSHSSVSDATMRATYGTCSQTQRTLASDDIAGARKLYGTGGSTNTAPSVTITEPASGITVTAGSAVAFSGSANDTQQGNLTSQLGWRSSLDGQIGTGGSFTRALTAGTHTITASVTDSGGLTTERNVIVYAVAAPSTSTAAQLKATARTSRKGIRSTKLEWSGLTSTRVDVYRNGTLVKSTANDGRASDRVPSKGTYTYKLCNEGTTTCTNQASVAY